MREVAVIIKLENDRLNFIDEEDNFIGCENFGSSIEFFVYRGNEVLLSSVFLNKLDNYLINLDGYIINSAEKVGDNLEVKLTRPQFKEIMITMSCCDKWYSSDINVKLKNSVNEVVTLF